MNLDLTLNAQFYKLRSNAGDAEIAAILEAAVQNSSGEAMLADEFRLPGRDSIVGPRFRYSLRVFQSARPVYFLPDSDLTDLIYSYVLLVELGGYLVVTKKGVANITDALEAAADQVTQFGLTQTFDDNQVQFQKLSVRNMTVSEKAVRSRSYEAADLKGVLSTHGAGRSIPYFLRLRHARGLSSISLGSARLVDSSERVKIEAFAAWAFEKVSRIAAGRANNSFLSAFASHVDLDEVMRASSPASILIDGGGLQEWLIEEDLQIYYVDGRGIEQCLSHRASRLVFRALERVYEIDLDLHISGLTPDCKIRRNKSTLSVASRTLSRLFTKRDGKRQSLASTVNSEGFLTICFADPRFMYCMGGCYRDTFGRSEIEQLVEVLKPVPGFSSATSEKGNPGAASVAFPGTSVFSKVEAVHSIDDYIFCDDLGNEWADHICLNTSESCFSFVHSKHGDPSLSASNLHEVVGQAIKNFGNMYFTLPEFMGKYSSKWRKTYSGTKIERTRRGRRDRLRVAVETALASYRLHRKCVLACTFLSKAELEREFAKVKSGRPVRGNVAQLFWIVSSFSHAARESGIIPIIYCQS